MTKDEITEAAKAAVAAWNALPEDERNGERPFIMGFNAGWEECLAQNRRTGPISEYLHNISDTSPQAAAARILAFLDWDGAGVGDVGPAMYYGDLRILAEAVAAASGLR